MSDASERPAGMEPFGTWRCRNCGRWQSMRKGYVEGTYPEDGEIFCSRECARAYDRKMEEAAGD